MKLYLLVLIFASSCNLQNQTSQNNSTEKNIKESQQVVDYKEHDKVTSGLLDKVGNLWFGTSNEGVYRYDGKSFVHFTEKDGLCDNFVTGFFEDVDHKLWIRTGSILCIYDGKTFAPFRTKDGQGLRDISFIVEDKEIFGWEENMGICINIMEKL